MIAKLGHNQPVGIVKHQLLSVIERIEKLEEEKGLISADIKDLKAEAKGNGFDVKTIVTIMKIRKMAANEHEEQEHLLATYMSALGMLPSDDESGEE
jgi:uncharacterized protein (UPF0335 family)